MGHHHLPNLSSVAVTSDASAFTLGAWTDLINPMPQDALLVGCDAHPDAGIVAGQLELGYASAPDVAIGRIAFPSPSSAGSADGYGSLLRPIFIKKGAILAGRLATRVGNKTWGITPEMEDLK